MLTEKLTGRGVTGMVEAHGEVKFGPNSDVTRWKKRMTARVKTAAAGFAPSNKRPRWAHHGTELKKTMRGSTTARRTKGGGFLYSAVGSTAEHAMYVDQGTGIYGGGGAYQGKILPPWTRGSPSLYESTWSPNTRTRKPVGTVTIRGQRPQHFFDKALMAGLRSGGMRTVGVPGSNVGSAEPKWLYTSLFGIGGFSGGAAFGAELAQWRKWRDSAWNLKGPDGKSTLGEGEAALRHVARRTQDIRRRQSNLTIRAEIRKVFAKDARSRKRRAADARRAAEKAKSGTKAKVATQKKPQRSAREIALDASQKYIQMWKAKELASAKKQRRGVIQVDSPPAAWGFWARKPDGTRFRVFWNNQSLLDMWSKV